MKWALVNQSNIVENIIVYDGISPYQPPANLALQQVNDWVGIGEDIGKGEVIPDAPKTDQEIKEMKMDILKKDISFVASYETEKKANPNLTFEQYYDEIEGKVEKS